jgi:hypothetical protein
MFHVSNIQLAHAIYNVSMLQRFVFDDSAIKEQARELSDLLNSSFPEGIPEHLVSDIHSLSSEVVLSYGTPTVGADGISQTLIALRLGSSFERLMTAMRAGEGNRIAHSFERITRA